MILRYFFAWFGMMLLAVLNGGFRDAVYKPHVGDLTAHQIATAALIIIFTAYFWLLSLYWRIESARQAWNVGLLWLSMTLAFEFGFGHFIAGNSWSKLLHEYNLLDGRVWVFIPLWMLIGPYVFYRLK